MSEIGENNQYDISMKKAQEIKEPESGEVLYADTLLQWRHEGHRYSSKLLNKSTRETKARWITVGSASDKETNTEGIYGMHPVWNSSNRSESFFYIKEDLKEIDSESPNEISLSEYARQHGITEIELIPFEKSSFDKERFNSMSKSSRKEPFVAMHLEDDKLSLANKGNFRAVLAKDGSAEELTRYVAPEKEVAVSEHVLSPGQYPLVMASPGLWKSGLTPDEAAKIIYHLYQENPDEKDPEKASKLLRDEAMRRLTERGEEIPDISVMVVNLDIPEKGVTSLSDRRTQKAAKSYGRGMAA